MEADDKDLVIEKYKRRSKIMSVIAGVMVFLTFIFFIYALIQKGFADEQMKLAVGNAQKVKTQSLNAMKVVEETRAQARMAEAAMEQARRSQQQCQEALQKALKK